MADLATVRQRGIGQAASHYGVGRRCDHFGSEQISDPRSAPPHLNAKGQRVRLKQIANDLAIASGPRFEDFLKYPHSNSGDGDVARYHQPYLQ